MTLSLRFAPALAFAAAILLPSSAMTAPVSPPAPTPFQLPLYPDAQSSVREDADSPAHPADWIARISNPNLSVYLPGGTGTRSAVVICPGGGYGGLAMDKEGHTIARWFNTLGVAGVVLKYRMPQSQQPGEPLPLQDARRAMQMVREHAREWHIDPHRVGIMGFSAGGHLASTLETHPTSAPEAISSRPDFALLAYPVISMQPELTHAGSRAALLGDHPDPALVEMYSNERQVTPQTPPTFLVHARDDDVVNVQNTLLFSQALQRAGVQHQTRIYNTGRHGFGMARGMGDVSEWPARAQAWLRSRRLLEVKP